MRPRIDTNLSIREEPDAWVHSACILCSNGCGLEIAVKDGRIVGVRGAAGHPVNFGVDRPVASYVDVDQADLLCLCGHNVAEAQTVLSERMLAAKQARGVPIIVVAPRRTPTVRQGTDRHLQLRAGTNVGLMNGIIHLLIARGSVNREFVGKYTVGFAGLEVVARESPPARVAGTWGNGIWWPMVA